VDATGLTAVVPLAMLLLGGAGAVLALIRRRNALVALGLLTIAIMPFGSALTIDGTMRRTFMVAPFMAVFCGVAVVEGVRLAREWAERYHRDSRTTLYVAAGIAAGLSLFIAGQNIYDYFWSFRDEPLQQWVFVTEFTASVSYIHPHENGTYVY
jgi:uncharacterized membrane protein